MLIDSHCHIPHKKYDMTPEEVVLDAKKAGVTKFISIGTSIGETELVVKTASQFPNVYPTVGIYPHEDKGRSLSDLEKDFRKVLSKCKKDIVGIGECGIDISNWENGRKIDEQIEIFEMQINIAKETSLPLIVHNRKGDQQVLKLLEKHKGIKLRGVVHCFDSDWDFAQKILDLGFYISFSGLITYPNKNALIEVVKNVPMNRFLVETDAPYLSPQEYRGQVNYPKYVRIVAEKVATIKEISIAEVEENSFKNTCSLFEI
ncbi:MAG: TatD family hydrolase [Patescibacteria group bacterium]